MTTNHSISKNYLLLKSIVTLNHQPPEARVLSKEFIVSLAFSEGKLHRASSNNASLHTTCPVRKICRPWVKVLVAPPTTRQVWRRAASVSKVSFQHLRGDFWSLKSLVQFWEFLNLNHMFGGNVTYLSTLHKSLVYQCISKENDLPLCPMIRPKASSKIKHSGDFQEFPKNLRHLRVTFPIIYPSTSRKSVTWNPPWNYKTCRHSRSLRPRSVASTQVMKKSFQQIKA